MPTGAANILANLPRTFAPPRQASPLRALAGAFGAELSQAENALAALMFAHWVDYADRNADQPTDLAAIAALYGLAPRDDETIEEFRAHLKRYVSTLLEGTATVRGIFRVVAECLGVVIADDDAQLDTWWNRRPPRDLITLLPCSADAATRLFGWPQASVRGVGPQSARFTGAVDLSRPLDLRGHSMLQLSVNGAAPVPIDLATRLDVAAASLDSIVAAFATQTGMVATASGGRLMLASSTTGGASTLEIFDVAGDAAPALLGIPPRLYSGGAPVDARLAGAIALPATLDLSERRYLRIVIDGVHAYEIDCAGANAAATTLSEVVAAIGHEVGAGVVALENGRLVLSSATPGLGGTIELRAPTTAAATQLLFGDAPAYVRGSDATPARVSGSADLSAGVDLSGRSKLMLAIDAVAPVIVGCAGAQPQKTLASEIAAAINRAVGLPVASQNGKTLTLTSRVTGENGRIRLLEAPGGDALDLILGFGPRRVHGADARAASLTGAADLTGGVDLRALRYLRIAVDDSDRATVDFAAAGLASAGIQPSQIVDAVNAQVGATLMSTDGARLTIASATPGAQSAVAVEPLETAHKRAFVSRAFPTDEASNAVLGMFAASASGTAPTSAVLIGSAEVRDGVDLRTRRYLRIALDDSDAWHDVDCVGTSPRPRAVLLRDIASAINHTCNQPGLASFADDHLVLRSARTGAASFVAVLGGAGDGAPAIFGSSTLKAAGSDPQRLIFTSLIDFSQGADLSVAGRVRLSIDGGAAADIDCVGANPARTTAAEIAGRINSALGATYASTDGRALRLGSALTGKQSSIAFLVPDAQDATRSIFGIAAGRTYHGGDATPASLTGARDLPATLDLSAAPWVRIVVDGGVPLLVDCRGADPRATTPAEIAARIDAAFATPKAARAVLGGARVSVVATSMGARSSIVLQPAADFDASVLLFGAPSGAKGSDSAPATLVGAVDLRTPVDLSRRAVLRLAFDGGRPVDVDLTGAAPDQTIGDEIAAAIDAVCPGSATVDDDGHLVLCSSTSGANSQVEVVPLRPIELIEYPESLATIERQMFESGGHFEVRNESATESSVTFELSSDHGFRGVHLINATTNYAISVSSTVLRGEVLTIGAARDGRIEATLAHEDGSTTRLPAQDVIAAPFMLTACVPFEGERPLAAHGPNERHALVLVDPLAQHAVAVEARVPAARQQTARVAAAQLPPPDALSDGAGARIEVLGRLSATGPQPALTDANGLPLVRVRAGAGVSFVRFDGRAVSAIGTFYPGGELPLLVVDSVAALFDVQIGTLAFATVTLDPRSGTRSLAARVASGDGRFVARDCAPADAFRLPRGRSGWTLIACRGERFDEAWFDRARFDGGACNVAGVFDRSRFNAKKDGAIPHGEYPELSRFGPLRAHLSVSVKARWLSHVPGRFVVNLPADLPPKFGARFNEARFASSDTHSQTVAGVVFDPPSDPSFIVQALSSRPQVATLVTAQVVPFVPLGWEPASVPFRQPRTRYLSGGGPGRAAALYLQEHGVPGAMAIVASSSGVWGNDIAVSVSVAGPAVYDVTISYAAACFECAQRIVLDGRLPPKDASRDGGAADALAQGVARAKAAGIEAIVTRERT